MPHLAFRIKRNFALGLSINNYDLQVNTYKYVGVNTCYPMSVPVSRLTAD